MMFKPALGELKTKLKDHHTYFPLALKFDFDHQYWFALYRHLTQGLHYHVLLESGRAGRYSVMACQPVCVLKGKNKELVITELNGQEQPVQQQVLRGNLLDLLRRWTASRQAPAVNDLPHFCGGLLGFFSYDLTREIERLPQWSQDDLKLPDIYLLVFERVLVYDHEQDQHWLVVCQRSSGDLEQNYAEAKACLLQWRDQLVAVANTLQHQGEQEETTRTLSLWRHHSQQQDQRQDIHPSFSKEAFIDAVQKVRDYIAAGDVFQANLSVRQSRPLLVPPVQVYKALREINPSPYMGYLHFPDMQVVCGSPEQLIRLKRGQLNTRPIAGTRPRGMNREEDLRLARELINHQKERAEHVMLVDLERNDLGRVCRFGSVKVTEFMVIEEYSHVMHIVSNVQGQLAAGKDAIDVIRAVFPGGTITGAPKVRTMEIIEELEPVRRGLYTGSIGWIDFNGDMELNIVIRTLLAKDGWAHVQAGAGIVIDSVPEKEYQESLNKAKALWKALEQSEARVSLSLVEGGRER
ncbi:para-aminobenzoate synthetase component 1 [Caldalkalibacillus uzonensis]|uniref:Para-aminobenzoate synthetase component 1 n=1 Tax=Caldalkalibacillus uzonensis TaxID=353224 RepID=A0ABU0CW67_9BACI|nr:anthranilate synthase component I family protein [Caldalkalibacillus uzonensis]MDQ0340663.1 para-aminobenzoate synthetase component 1 [Caldalkalibacillus uzonensis]